MNDIENFRQINSFEREIILQSLSTISPKILQILDDLQCFIYISFIQKEIKNIFPEIFLLSNNQKKIVELVKIKNIIHSGGLYFGFIKNSNFYLSLEGAEFLFKKQLIPQFKHLILNKKGEKSFLYGNNILKDMIEKFPHSIKINDFLIVINKLGEILGLALSKCEDKNIHSLGPKTISAINLSDKGYYLRKAQ
jgi:ribosome biogenesis protein Nip4